MSTNDRQSSVATTIYEDLLRRIVSGELRAGERLPPERDLAADFGANRHTVREALRKLEQARLVTVRHGQGVTIADFRSAGTIEILGPFIRYARDPQDLVHVIIDLMMARVQVLEMAVGVAAQRARPEDIARIEDLAAAQVAAFARGDRQALVRGDIALVEALVDASHSLTVRWIANTLLEVYRDLVERVTALWVLDPSFPDYLETLLAAMRGGDAEGAVAATRAYYQRTDTTLLEVLERLMGPRPSAGGPGAVGVAATLAGSGPAGPERQAPTGRTGEEGR